MISAFKRDPFFRAFGEHDFLDRISGEAQASDECMAEPCTKNGFGLAKIAAGIFYFDWSDADFDTVDFHSCAGRSAVDAKLIRAGRAGEREAGKKCELCAQSQREGHQWTPCNGCDRPEGSLA